METIPWRRNSLFEVFEGRLSADEVYDELMKADTGGVKPRARRYFYDEDEIFHVDKKTYVLTNQWGARAQEAADLLAKHSRNWRSKSSRASKDRRYVVAMLAALAVVWGRSYTPERNREGLRR